MISVDVLAPCGHLAADHVDTTEGLDWLLADTRWYTLRTLIIAGIAPCVHLVEYHVDAPGWLD